MAAFTAVDLRRGRYAPAQLWKLTSIGGVGLNLADLVAPFIGDVYAVVPPELVALCRHLNRLAILREVPQNIHQMRVRVFADEVVGMVVHYTTVGAFPRAIVGVLPPTAGIFDYFCTEVRFAPLDFEADWEEHFGVQWPMVRHNGHREIHPALVELWARAVEIEGLIVQNNERRLEAAHHGYVQRNVPARLAYSRAFVELVRDMSMIPP